MGQVKYLVMSETLLKFTVPALTIAIHDFLQNEEGEDEDDEDHSDGLSSSSEDSSESDSD